MKHINFKNQRRAHKDRYCGNENQLIGFGELQYKVCNKDCLEAASLWRSGCRKEVDLEKAHTLQASDEDLGCMKLEEKTLTLLLRWCCVSSMLDSSVRAIVLPQGMLGPANAYQMPALYQPSCLACLHLHLNSLLSCHLARQPCCLNCYYCCCWRI